MSLIGGISFENTEVAFSAKTDKDLNKAYGLFKLINNSFLVKLGPHLVQIALKLKLPVKKAIKSTIFNHFCGGESIGDCEKTIKNLFVCGIGTILDYSVEGKETENDFDDSLKETLATIYRAKGDIRIPFTVFKPTSLGRLDLLEKVNTNISQKHLLTEEERNEFERVKTRIEKLCKAAHEYDVSIFIDAEESWIQNIVDELSTEMMLKYNVQKAIVYNTVQMYRTNRLELLKDLLKNARDNNYILGIKLVRGAYMEKERARAKKMGYKSPIQINKEHTDKDYNEALKFCVENINRIALCAGTHNEESSLLLTKLVENSNIPKNHRHIYFSQLYGMSDHISYNLVKNGFNVAKYVPYGPVTGVLPYLFRRAQENTSVSGQMGRELGLIIREKKRRKEVSLNK